MPALKSNRVKALIFINLMALSMFFQFLLLKIGIREHGLDILDLCVVRSLFIILASLSIALCMGASFEIEKKNRTVMLSRAIFGTVRLLLMTYGVAMVPLAVQFTISDTAPIWASILGCIFLGEQMTRF